MKIQIKKDDTFIVDFNGLPFHVTPEYPKAEQYGVEMTHVAIKEYAKSRPQDVTEYIEPVPQKASKDDQALAIQSKIFELEISAQEFIRRIQVEFSDEDVTESKARLKDVMIVIEILNLELEECNKTS